MPKNQQKVTRVGLISATLTGADFQRQVCDLWKHTKGRPKDPIVYAIPQHEESSGVTLPLEVETELSDGFAYIAAARKGVESVSASAIGIPNIAHDGLIVYVASNDGVQADVQGRLRSIVLTVQRVASREISKEVCKALVLTEVLRMNSGRINARLKGRKHNLPIVLQGLEQTLAGLVVPMHNAGDVAVLRQRLSSLCESLRTYSVTAKSSTSIQDLERLVLACRQFWAAPGSESTRDMLVRAGVNVNEMKGNSCLLQVAKIAAYDFVSNMLVIHASKFETLFQHITLRFVPARDPVPTKVPAAIAGGGTQRRVHAEVQLVIALDTIRTTKWKRPRTIGSSKAACFLCDLFLQKHETYFVPRSHGLLTRFWAIPNSERFTAAQRQNYQLIVTAMCEELIRLTKIQHPHRYDPAMSWQALSQLGAQRDSRKSSRVPTPSVSVQSLGVPSVLSCAMEKKPPSSYLRNTAKGEFSKNRSIEDAGMLAERNSDIVSAPVSITGDQVSTSVHGSSTTKSGDNTFTGLPSNITSNKVIDSFTDVVPQETAMTELARRQPDGPEGPLSSAGSKHRFQTHSTHGSEDSLPLGDIAVAADTQNMGRTLEAGLTSPDSISSGAASHVPCSVRFDASGDLDRGGRHLSVNIEGHESRIRNTVGQNPTPTFSWPDHCLKVTYSDNLCQRINFHDWELFLEAEPPATALVSVRPRLADEALDDTPVVDIGALTPGDEISMSTDNRPGREESLRLTMQIKPGVQQHWAVKWEMLGDEGARMI